MGSSKNTTNQQHSKNLGLIERYATFTVALIIVLLCIVLFIVGLLAVVAPPIKETLTSFSVSLFASLVFALFYSSLVDKHHLNAINNQLAQSVQRAVDEMKQTHEVNMREITTLTLAKIDELQRSYYSQISLHFRELVPADSFPPTNQPDKRFNEVLTNALKQSRQYLFKGVTGRYISSRLVAAGHHNFTCRVLLVDPHLDDLLRLYVRDRFGAPVPGAEINLRVQRVKQEIYMTVVDLFDQSQQLTVDIRLHSGPVFYRTEIMDDQLMISFFTAKDSTAYPMTYLYKKDSFFYDVFFMDFNQAWELARSTVTFSSRSTESDLESFLTKIGCDPAKLPELRAEAQDFRKEFLSMF